MEYVKRLNEGGLGTHAAIGSGTGGENNDNNTPRGKPPGGNQDHDMDNGHGNASSSQPPANGVKSQPGASKSITPLPSPSTPASMSSSGSKLFPTSISPLTSDGGNGHGNSNGIDVKKKKSWLLSRK